MIVEYDVSSENIFKISLNTYKNENTERFKVRFYIDDLVSKRKLWNKETDKSYS